MTSTYTLQPLDTFVLSIIVLFVGMTLTRKARILKKYNIPPAVTGGLICSIVIALISVIFDIRITFDMQIRNFLLWPSSAVSGSVPNSSICAPVARHWRFSWGSPRRSWCFRM